MNHLPVTHLSYSSVSLYLTCPRQWKYRYIDQIPTGPNEALLFGSAWHKAVEHYVGDGRDVPSLRSTLAEQWWMAWEEALDGVGSLPDHVADKVVELAALGAVLASNSEILVVVDAIRPVAVERRVTFMVPGVPVPVIGYIDAVLPDDTLVDFKTAGKPWAEDRIQKYERQPAFYLSATGGHKFRHVVFVKSWRPAVQVIDSEWPDPQGVAFPMVREAWDGIGRGDFRCKPERCEWCDYKELCNCGVEVY